MGLKDYFVGRRLVLISPLTASEVQARINDSAGSSVLPFSMGTVGWARFGRFRLRQRTSLFDYNAKPMLIGKMIGIPEGTRIEANFGATLWMKAFLVFWYAFLALWTVIAIATGPFEGNQGDLAYFPYLMVPLFAVMPIGMHYLFNHSAEKDLKVMLRFLDTAAKARIDVIATP